MESPNLSPLDSAFLFFERPTQPLHVGCLAELDGAVDHLELLETMRVRLEPLHRFRQRPVRSLFDLRAPTWQDDPSFAMPHHIHRIFVPSPGGEAELHETVDALLSAPLPAERSPWQLYSLEGLAGGRGALLWKVHHCLVDGVSGAQIITLTTDPEAGAEAAPGPRLPSSPGAGATRASWLGGAGAILEVGSTLSSLALSPASRLPFHGTLGPGRRLVWSSFALDEILAIRGASECKLNDVVLAIVAGALRHYLDRRGLDTRDLRVRAIVPVSIRTEGDRLSLGNLVTAMFPALPVGIVDPLERLRRIAAEMVELKGRGQHRAAGFALAAASLLPVPIQALVGRVFPERTVFSTVVTNVPGPREGRTLLGRRVEALHPMVPLFQGMGLEFAVLSYGGRVSIAATADADLVPDAERIAEALVRAEQELYDACVSPARRRIKGAPPVGFRTREIMRRDVVTVAPEDSVLRAYRLMRTKRIRHLPVVDRRGRLLGILSHRDVLGAMRSSLEPIEDLARFRNLGATEVADLMESHVSTIRPEEPAAEAGRRIVHHRVGCLPVVDDAGALIGIVTATDFVRWAAEALAEATHETTEARVHA